MTRGTWFRVLVTLLILGWLCYRINWTELAATARTLRASWWITSVAAVMCVQLLLSYRWRMLARPLGFDDAWSRYVQLYLVGLYFNLFMPSNTGGDVVRALYLDDNRGKRPLALVSVFVEQTSNLLVLLSLGVFAAVLCWATLPPWLPLIVLAVCGGAVAIAVTTVCISGWVSRRLATAQSRVLRFVHDYVQGFADAVATYRQRWGVFVRSLAVAVVAYTLNVGSAWMVARALGIDVSLSYMMTIIPLIGTLLILPVSINGIGVREASLTVFLAPLAVSESAAVSLGLITFSNSVLVSLLGGAIYSVGRFPKLSFRSPVATAPTLADVREAAPAV